jgi:alanine dehydrogenase
MKNFPTPVKIFTIIGTLLTVIAVLAFSTPNEPGTSSKLIVTSQSEATFDFCIISDQYEKGRKDFLKQKTPFEMGINAKNCKILLNKVSGNSLVNFKLADERGSI